MTIRRLGCAAAFLLLAACAQEPGRPLMSALAEGVPYWDNYGYTENELPGGGYEVIYLSREEGDNFFAAAPERLKTRLTERTLDFALWRAAELAHEKGAQTFLVTQSQLATREKIRGRDPDLAIGPHDPRHARILLNLNYYSSLWLQPEVFLTVEFDPQSDAAGNTEAVRKTGGVLTGLYRTDGVLSKMAGKYPGARDPALPVTQIP